MDHPRMTLELRPVYESAHTQIVLRGRIGTVPSATDMRRFLALLASWHGGPVHVVLSVGGTDADICWAQRWDTVISGVPVPHVEIRYEVRGITSVAPIGHER